MIASIIDSPGGNKGSVKAWLERGGLKCNFISNSLEINESNLIVFPGNGTFSETIDWIETRQFKNAIYNYINSGNLYIGICIGMHIMFANGIEGGKKKGLGLIKGDIQRLETPRIGWNKVDGNFNGFAISSDFYFMHNYGFLENSNCLNFIRYKNSFLFQFHPEKSGLSGDKLLKKILEDHV